jgi:acetyl/propionyl-CoA carboxylase alpha subunit
MLCKEGQLVKAGDVLCIISAMKMYEWKCMSGSVCMEVKVSAPVEGKICVEATSVGYRGVEGALLFSFK